MAELSFAGSMFLTFALIAAVLLVAALYFSEARFTKQRETAEDEINGILEDPSKIMLCIPNNGVRVDKLVFTDYLESQIRGVHFDTMKCPHCGTHVFSLGNGMTTFLAFHPILEDEDDVIHWKLTNE